MNTSNTKKSTESAKGSDKKKTDQKETVSKSTDTTADKKKEATKSKK